MARVLLSTRTIDDRHGRGFFRLHCTNRRVRGFRPLDAIDCEGVCYSSGHVHLDTRELPITDFVSVAQLLDYLQELGDGTITWIEDEEPQ